VGGWAGERDGTDSIYTPDALVSGLFGQALRTKLELQWRTLPILTLIKTLAPLQVHDNLIGLCRDLTQCGLRLEFVAGGLQFTDGIDVSG
jgi:hypothetical protein